MGPYYSLQPSNGRLEKSVTFILKIHSEKMRVKRHMLQPEGLSLGIGRKSSDRKNGRTLGQVLLQVMWNLFPEELFRTSLLKNYSGLPWAT